jgi:hypothetical protein
MITKLKVQIEEDKRIDEAIKNQTSTEHRKTSGKVLNALKKREFQIISLFEGATSFYPT